MMSKVRTKAFRGDTRAERQDVNQNHDWITDDEQRI